MFFPPLGFIALVLLLLGVRERRLQLARVASDETESAASSVPERNPLAELKFLNLSAKLALFAIIFGALNYASAGVVFGLTILNGGLGYVRVFQF